MKSERELVLDEVLLEIAESRKQWEHIEPATQVIDDIANRIQAMTALTETELRDMTGGAKVLSEELRHWVYLFPGQKGTQDLLTRAADEVARLEAELKPYKDAEAERERHGQFCETRWNLSADCNCGIDDPAAPPAGEKETERG